MTNIDLRPVPLPFDRRPEEHTLRMTRLAEALNDLRAATSLLREQEARVRKLVLANGVVLERRR